MAHRKLDSVQQIATGTGTGALTLGAATAANYRTMQAAGMTNADTGTFRIQHETILAEWEEVLVTYSAGAITRTFDTNAKSATAALINFSAGNKIVSCIARAGDSVVMDNNGDAAITRDAAIGRNLSAAGSVNAAATSGYLLGGVSFAVLSTSYHLIKDPASVTTLQLGNASDPSNYYWNTTHTFGSRNAGSNFATINSGGATYYVSQIINKSDPSLLFADTAAFRSIFLRIAGGVNRLDSYNWPITSTQPFTTNASLHYWNVADVEKLALTASELRPGNDNAMTLGTGSFRWSVVYAGTGAINTSGRDAKLFVSAAIAAEKRAAATIKAKPRRYKLKDSVDEKGEARARWHFGYVAEDVRDALAAEGLDPWAYAFLCSDPIIKRETYFEMATRAKTRKVTTTESAVEIIDGKPVMVAKQMERDEPVGVMVAVVDEQGQPVMHQIGADEEPGEPIIAPLMHLVPEMEEYEVERTREVDTGEVRLGLRYSELEAFLRSAD